MEKDKRNTVRFISLRGFSGIVVGIVGLIGAYLSYLVISNDYSREEKYIKEIISSYDHYSITVHAYMGEKLFFIAIFSLSSAIIASFLTTYYQNKKYNQPLWNKHVNTEISNLGYTLIVAMIFEMKLIDSANYGLIIPTSLVFYGGGLLFVSRYSLGYIKYLGIAEIVLGLINLWITDWGVIIAGIGFGLFHLLYGFVTLLLFDGIYIKSIKSNGKW